MDDDVPTVWGFVYVYVVQFQLMPVCVFIANAMSVHSTLATQEVLSDSKESEGRSMDALRCGACVNVEE